MNCVIRSDLANNCIQLITICVTLSLLFFPRDLGVMVFPTVPIIKQLMIIFLLFLYASRQNLFPNNYVQNVLIKRFCLEKFIHSEFRFKKKLLYEKNQLYLRPTRFIHQLKI